MEPDPMEPDHTPVLRPDSQETRFRPYPTGAVKVMPEAPIARIQDAGRCWRLTADGQLDEVPAEK
jgi:hypothetical protein